MAASLRRPPPPLQLRLGAPSLAHDVALALSAATPQQSLASQAMRWTYVLRSRRRWLGDEKAKEQHQVDAAQTLAPWGLTDELLAQAVKAERLVVKVPYESEGRGWEARIFPWEYVLAAATRRQRADGSADGQPRPLTVMRQLERQGRPAIGPQHVPTQALFVECMPTELRGPWGLDDELRRLRAALPSSVQWQVLSYPTLDGLQEALRQQRPGLVHLAGMDSHQGLNELRQSLGLRTQVDVAYAQADAPPDPRWVDDVINDEKLMVDGVLLRGDSGLPRLVRAQALAAAMAASGHCAYLLTCNLWNTSARVAPLAVAEGAALAAVGFQDAFDDALAEFFHATLYQQLVDTGWQLPEAFHQTWLRVRDLPESEGATGVSLWAGAPVFAPRARDRSAAGAGAGATTAGIDSPPPADPVRCDIEDEAELNYAVLHNAQPLFRRFILECDQPRPDRVVDVDVAVHMGSESARFLRRVAMSGTRLALTRDIHVPLTAALARTVREAVNSSVSVEVREGDSVRYRDTHRLRLLPVDQWRDNSRDGQWLPSFVQPRDPAVVQAVLLAQRYTRVLRDDPSAGFEGYQLARPGDEESLRGVDRQVEAIWATLLHDWQLGYINPPPSYSGALDSQRLRSPGTVWTSRAGTCIDLALLFASCLELVDIYPVIFLLDGHALPGWWRHPDFHADYQQARAERAHEIVQADAQANSVAGAQSSPWHLGKAGYREVARWISERKLVPIETVRLTEHCGFIEAIEAGVQAMSERRDFDSMLDIVTARQHLVTPLPVLPGQA
jgi:hypothetical protein